MLVKFVSLEKTTNGQYTLKEIMINPKHIIYIQEEPTFQRKLREGKLPLGLISEAQFTSITVSDTPHNKKVIVVGQANEIEAKIFQKSKRLLRG